MNDTMTTVLRVGFLVVLIWVLAALVGAAPGASVQGPGFAARIGPKSKRRGCGRRGLGPRGSYARSPNGMVGELIPSTGAQPQLVGMSYF